MRALSTEIQNALSARALVARDFLWVVARDRVTGNPVTDGAWSDVGTLTAAIIDPDIGAPVERTWSGQGTLISISDVQMLSNITVRRVTITLSQISDRAMQLVHGYDCKQARVEVYRGLFDPSSRRLVAPAPARFVGFVDTINIKTPTENDVGGVVLDCTSHTQEMTRSNPDTRSHESQILRHAGDSFFKDAPVVGEWELFWGKAGGTVPPPPTVESMFKKYGF
jgi:hypothetical protein